MTKNPLYIIKPAYAPHLFFWGLIGFGILVVNLLNGSIWQGISIIGVISPIALLDIWLWRISASYYIYDDCIIAKTGILSTHRAKIMIDDIKGIDMHKSLIGNLFNYGNLGFGTAATGGTEIVMKSINNPEGVMNLFDN